MSKEDFNNLLDTSIDLITKVNQTDKLPSQKKRFVMDFLQRQFNNPEEWELYSEMISSLVDFLVAVGKRKKDFRLVKSKLFSFSCCQ